MALIEEFERDGNILFRYRSFIPLIMIGIILAFIPKFTYLAGKHIYDELWEIFCLSISFLGIFIRAVTVGYVPKRTSGRNTKKGQVADYLNTKGMYSIIRHPLYFGNFFIILGVILFFHSILLVLVYLLLYIVYYERIMFAEEMFLRRKFGKKYIDWSKKVPAFFPRHFRWEQPELSFSFKNVIKREYHGITAVIIVMFVEEEITDFSLKGKFDLDLLWQILIVSSILFYITVRYLRKYTNLLRVEGR